MNYASPGVYISETELGTSLTQSIQNVGIVTLAASIGPVDTITYITSENQLLSVFGPPNDNNFEDWYAAREFMAYGGVVGVIRPSNSSGSSSDTAFAGTGANALQLLTNANVTNGAALTNLLIRNVDEYRQQSTYNYIFAGRVPSALYNNLAVYAIDKGADQVLTVSNASIFTTGEVIAIGYSFTASASGGTGSPVLTSTNGGFAGVTVGANVSGTGIASGTTVISVGSNGTGGQENNIITLSARPTAAISNGTITFQNYVKNGNGGAVYAYVYRADTVNNVLHVTLKNPIYSFSSFNDVICDATTLAPVAVNISNVSTTAPYSTRTYDGVNLWQNIASQPNTTSYVASRGGLFDEMHIIVTDYTGKISGVPGTVLEIFTNVSKASDALNSSGSSNYYKNVIATQSKYIYAGNSFIQSNTFTVVPEILANTSELAATIGSVSLNAVFSLFRNATTGAYNNSIAYTPNSNVNTFNNASSTNGFWAGGRDYDFVGNPTAIENGLLNSYELVADITTFNEFDFLLSGKQTISKAQRLISIVNRRKDLLTCITPSTDLVVGNGSNVLSSATIARNAVGYFSQISPSSYAVVADNYKYIYDTYNAKFRWVSTATDVAGCIVRAKINGDFFFSPAGVQRGGILNCIKLAYNPKLVDRDLLYTNYINPVIIQPGYGFTLFGDKTFTKTSSVFDRINKRTLFLGVESAANQFAISLALFEFNNDVTRSLYKAAMNGVLQAIQSSGGIVEYYIQCDSSNNTVDDLNNQVFNARFYIKPANATNAVFLNFIGTRANVDFSEIIQGL